MIKSQLPKGSYVLYKRYATDKGKPGIVKSYAKKTIDFIVAVFVVLDCNNDWTNYRNYKSKYIAVNKLTVISKEEFLLISKTRIENESECINLDKNQMS